MLGANACAHDHYIRLQIKGVRLHTYLKWAVEQQLWTTINYIKSYINITES